MFFARFSIVSCSFAFWRKAYHTPRREVTSKKVEEWKGGQGRRDSVPPWRNRSRNASARVASQSVKSAQSVVALANCGKSTEQRQLRAIFLGSVPRYRGTGERFFSHLLDAHGGRHVSVRTPKKVFMHLMYSVLVIAVEQTMRILC